MADPAKNDFDGRTAPTASPILSPQMGSLRPPCDGSRDVVLSTCTPAAAVATKGWRHRVSKKQLRSLRTLALVLSIQHQSPISLGISPRPGRVRGRSIQDRKSADFGGRRQRNATGDWSIVANLRPSEPLLSVRFRNGEFSREPGVLVTNHTALTSPTKRPRRTVAPYLRYPGHPDHPRSLL